MTRHLHLCVVVLLGMAFVLNSEAAKGGARGRIQRGRGRIQSPRMPMFVPHRNPASFNYYEHKDVSSNLFLYYPDTYTYY